MTNSIPSTGETSATPSQITIDTIEVPGGSRTFTLQTDHGQLLATYEPLIGMFSISRVDVEPDSRRRGIAKALLSTALHVAEECEAQEIFASITSRESINAITSVFGEDSVHVMNLGTYAPETKPGYHDASAVLLHKLTRTS